MSDQQLRDSIGYCPFTGDLFCIEKSAPRSTMKVGEVVGRIDDQGYVRFQFANKKQRAHRVAHLLMTGSWPSNLMDHKDRVRHNNCWDNLREVSPKENRANSNRAGTLKLKHI